MSARNEVTKEFEALLSEDLHKTASEKAKEKVIEEGPLLPEEAHTVKIEHELSQYVQYAKRRCKEGFRLCQDAVCELANTDTTIQLETFHQNMKQAFSKFDTTAHILDMSNQVTGGTTWKELLGMNGQTMQYLYQGAKKLFADGHYPEAEAAFFFLTTVDFAEYSFWLGLGHAAYQLGNINQAINAYETADICQPGSVWPNIYIANCFEKLHDFDESLIALEKAKEEHENLSEHDQDLLLSLQERINKARTHS